MKRRLFFLPLMLFLLGVVSLCGTTHRLRQGVGASSKAIARATVLQAVRIEKNSDLSFGSGVLGDQAKVVTPTPSQESAIFTITGEPGRSYTLELPASIVLTTANGIRPNERLVVDSFNFQTEGASGTLDSWGHQTVFVGASRSAIPAFQSPGLYSGSFTITLVY